MNFLKSIITIIFIFIFASLYSAVSSRIDFQIRGLEGKKIIFASQYGEKQLLIDTILLDQQAKGFYESKTRLIGGIYVVAFPNGKYFELLINEEQFFSILTDTAQTLENLVIEGSEETDMFRKYQLLASNFQKAIKSQNNKDLEIKLKNQIDSFKNLIFEKHKSSFLSSYLKLQQDPKMPDNIIKPGVSGKEQFLLQRNYLKNHYFDNVDFDDNRLLRTRLLHEKLSFYFNVLLSQQSDSLIKEIDHLLVKAKVMEESYRYVLNFLITNYRNPQKPYQEKILVHLADNFYLNGKASWADPRFLTILEEKAHELRNNTTGAKAPDLILQTIKNEALQLHNIKASYLLVFFFSADCKICNSEAEIINEKYKSYKSKGLEVLAIYTHADKQSFMNFVDQTGYKWVFAYDPLLKSNFAKLYQVKEVPTLYLLDENKTILKKNFKARELIIDY